MLVFSRWGYNHKKLFANALGLHHRVKNKIKQNKKKTGRGGNQNEKQNHEMTLKITTKTANTINPTPLTRFS